MMARPARRASRRAARSAGAESDPRGLLSLIALLSAFLLFLVQPLLGKRILPWFGGTPAVWTACLVFFQALLLAGYALAWGVASRLGRRAQLLAWIGMLFVAAWWPVIPGETWKPAGVDGPLAHILAMLGASAGVPFIALAATGPLLQRWYAEGAPRSSPYRLYAYSNAGSLLALLCYPLAIEPRWSVTQQARLWIRGLVLLLLLGLWLLWRFRRAAAAQATSREAGKRSPLGRRPLWWIAWSACGVVLFMAVTSQLTLNVAAVPFLWVLPLAIYLLTFVAAFSGRPVYRRAPFALLLAAALVALWRLVPAGEHLGAAGEIGSGLVGRIVLYAAALLVADLVCHAELYRLRPEGARLNAYYVAIAAGGLLGGVIVGVVAPYAFPLHFELYLGMLACAGLFVATLWRGTEARTWIRVAASCGCLLLAFLLARQGLAGREGVVLTRRSFFGVLRLHETDPDDPQRRTYRLLHGSTVHGMQFQNPEIRDVPTMYYSPYTGVGAVLEVWQKDGPVNVGVVGLGVGTLAAYGRAEDTLRFYEIDPDVVELALTRFHFLKDCPAYWLVETGDARLALEREPEERFDVLVLDAFSSDAIPVHLLTREAFALYQRHLAPGGAIAVHISNRYLDLSGVLYAHADAMRFQALTLSNHGSAWPTSNSVWTVLSRDTARLDALVAHVAPLRERKEMTLYLADPQRREGLPQWTDEFSNLFDILR